MNATDEVVRQENLYGTAEYWKRKYFDQCDATNRTALVLIVVSLILMLVSGTLLHKLFFG